MSTSLGNPDGTISERAIRFYSRLARGRTGLIMTEYAYVDEMQSKGAHCQFGISRDEHVVGLAWLAGAIQAEGAAAGVQIVHTGRQSETSQTPKAPSPVRWEHGAMPSELTPTEIDEIVAAFGSAARRAHLAGFNLVEVHAAHGYLLTQFLSPHTNRRLDDYGGSFANRRRIVEQVLREVRSSVPADFTVTMRVSCTDYRSDGITLDETVELCRIAQRLGVDAIHVSGGDHETGHWQWSPMVMPHTPHATASHRIRDVLSIPVIASGSIVSPERAERLLADGSGDFVALARPLLADPDWPAKARAGRPDKIRPCIRCNDGCIARSALLLRATSCSVNPAVENDLALGFERARHARSIAVVGGGVSGMVAALTLAERGHDVTLFERNRLGGALHAATQDAYKSDLRSYGDYLVRRIERSPVAVLFREAAVSDLSDGRYEAVVVATGARRSVARWQVDAVATVVEATHARPDAAGDGAALVVGGGYAGVEAALRLAHGERAVTVLLPFGSLLPEAEEMERLSYQERLHAAGVVVKTHAVERIDAAGVLTPSGLIPASLVAVEPETEPENSLATQLKGIEVHVVGDAVVPGKVHDAVHSAYKTARRL